MGEPNPKIVQLRKNLYHTIEVDDPMLGGKVPWVLRPLPAWDLMKNYSVFEKLPKGKELNFDPETMTDEDRKLFTDSVLPMMEVFLPACSVDPVVVLDEEDARLKANTAIHIREIPHGVLAPLFVKIIEISGLSEAAEKLRKNLQTPPSVS